MIILHTARLRLEPFSDEHFDGLYRMTSDLDVMRYITGRPQTREETQEGIDRIKQCWKDWGFSWWAWIDKTSEQIVGAGCIQFLARKPENPLEIGWRLQKDQWGKGYATEAARVMAAHAFNQLQAPILYSVCDPANSASSHVMEKLGMTYRGIERWYDVDTATYTITREKYLSLNP